MSDCCCQQCSQLVHASLAGQPSILRAPLVYANTMIMMNEPMMLDLFLTESEVQIEESVHTSWRFTISQLPMLKVILKHCQFYEMTRRNILNDSWLPWDVRKFVYDNFKLKAEKFAEVLCAGRLSREEDWPVYCSGQVNLDYDHDHQVLVGDNSNDLHQYDKTYK